MKKNTIIMVFIAGAILLNGFCVDWCYEKWMAEKAKSKNLELTINKLHQDLETLTVRINDSTVVHGAIVEDMRMTQKNLEARCGELMKKLSIKAKNVDHYINTTTFVHDTVYREINVDTAGVVTAEYVDNFTNIKVAIDNGTALFDYSIKDSISVFNVRKKHSILFGLIKWKGEPKTTIINHNPKAIVTEFNAIEILE